MFVNRIAATLALALAASCTGLASAQEETAATGAGGGIDFSIGTAFEHQLEANLDGSGDLDINRFRFTAGATTDLSRDLELSLRFGYDLDLYNFDGPVTFLGGDDEPWDDIHTLGMAAILSAKMTSDLTFFGGPVFQFSRESGADWDDAWIAGGVAGATLKVSDDLTIGGGVGVVSQLQDKARFFPVIIVDWHISDRLRLSNRAASNAGGTTGTELIYAFSDQWEAAVGGRYEFRRFRLDDEGAAADGVGEESRLPIYGRVTYNVNSNFSISALCGFTLYNELEIEEANGNVLGSPEVDGTVAFGVTMGLRF